MRLSEQLKQDNDCGDFGKALEGYSERAGILEDIAWSHYYNDACKWNLDNAQAKEFADKMLNEI